MPYNAIDLSKKELSNKDKAVLATFIHNPNISARVYDKNSKQLEVFNAIYVVDVSPTEFGTVNSSKFELTTQTKLCDNHPYEIVHKETGKYYPPMDKVVVTDPDSLVDKSLEKDEKSRVFIGLNMNMPTCFTEEQKKIVSLSDYTAHPQGAVWERYLSEIVIIPFLDRDGLFSDSKHISDYFDCSGDEPSPEFYKDTYLVWHPKTLTGCQMTVDGDGNISFYTTNLNMPYSSDSIMVALTSPFNWALTECGY